MTTIELVDVTKRIHKNTVIDHVSATFTSGAIVGLKGINGSGKTMLMRLVSGLIKPTQGKIRINEHTLGQDISFPESIGILLENPAFLDPYSGLENLRMLASIKNTVKDEQIKKVIEIVGLDPEDKKKYRKYSLGMKQRLGIAAAIMESPDIIILDEPTNSLDSDGVSIVKDIVTRERNRGALVILACHDYEVLRLLADEIYVIEKGRITDHIKEAGA
ncbi:MAG TPA: multidrug ABC transporter ATP-binding protein [Ruminococcaceae bacterium]|nr:multidrug ABC transporter ATP-binding protein [Oscillospiraceae bacterium]HCA29243.1 multidrug ABC transporter ATP-binding protein [Oscillospiraceae bacterium]